MNATRLSVYIDLIFCFVILPVIITLIPVDKWLEKYTLFVLALLVFLYLMYFTIRRVNFVRLLQKRKYAHIVLLIIVSTGVAFCLSRIPYPDETSYIVPDRIKVHMRSQTVWLLFLVVVGFSLSINLMLELMRQSLEKKEVEVQKNKAELALYKSQIRPHFMFNTLNTLYGLLVSKSSKAEEAFMKFAEMVQYMYMHAKDDKVELRDEIDYISHYIDIQSLRFNFHTKVVWSCDISDEHVCVPPMIFITFVENAFKYGSSPSRDSIIDISISQENGVLSFKVVNDVVRHPERDDASSGVGIENCRSRLDIVYPDRYTLITEEENGKFVVSLTIVTA